MLAQNGFIQNFQFFINYLQEHPLVFVLVLLSIIALIGLVIWTSPRKMSPVPQVAATTPFAIAKVSQKDLAAIAGDDVMATQLDLAKAYIEMDQKKLAKPILQDVIKQGTPTQQVHAQTLIESL